MKLLSENDPKKRPKAPPSINRLHTFQDSGNRSVGKSIYDVVTRIPGHEAAWDNLSNDQRWEILEHLRGAVNNVQGLKGDDGKVGMGSALKFGYNVDLSSIKPFREGLGLSKSQFLDHLQNSIVSHVSEKNESIPLEEIQSSAENIRNKFGFLANLKRFRGGGKFRLLKK